MSRGTKENEFVEGDVKLKLSRALTEVRGVGNRTVCPTPHPVRELSDTDPSELPLDRPLSATKKRIPATHTTTHYPAPDEQMSNDVTTRTHIFNPPESILGANDYYVY
ncbi:hypothetical protein AHF37_06179 [Paragonimus kellicotti]|nr:hypothetical protein AHF37_06179 [Paragonimus kellicotti]